MSTYTYINISINRSTPVLLEGGFEMFRLAFPHMVTDPKVSLPCK